MMKSCRGNGMASFRLVQNAEEVQGADLCRAN